MNVPADRDSVPLTLLPAARDLTILVIQTIFTITQTTAVRLTAIIPNVIVAGTIAEIISAAAEINEII